MARIRSNTETQGAAHAVTTDAPKQALTVVAVDVRELSALRRTATDHFETRIARVPIDN